MGSAYAAPVLTAVRPVVKAATEAEALTPLLDERPLTAVTREDIARPLDAFVLHDVLSAQECERLMAHSEALAYSFWHADQSAEKREFRNADTVEVHDADFAARLWDRMRNHVPAQVTLEPGDRRWERDLDGTWQAVGVNHVLLFARYGEGGHFSPHTDGYTVVDFNHRSLYSLLVYLNNCSDGGATRLMAYDEDRSQQFVRDDAQRFRWPESRVLGSAPVSQGTALAFYQDIPHEGEPVGPGCAKYIIRTDIMFERTPMICTGRQDEEAYRLFREAECLECEGDPMQAAVLYRKVRE